MNITIKSDEVLPEIVMDFAFGKIKKFINKHYGENNNKIIKGHGYVFITYKNELGVGCTVKREG